MGFLPLALFPEKENHKQKENIGVMSWALTNTREKCSVCHPQITAMSQLLGPATQGKEPQTPPSPGGSNGEFCSYRRRSSRGCCCKILGSRLHPRDATAQVGVGPNSSRPPQRATLVVCLVFCCLLFIQMSLLAERSQDGAKQYKHHPSEGLAALGGPGTAACTL